MPYYCITVTVDADIQPRARLLAQNLQGDYPAHHLVFKFEPKLWLENTHKRLLYKEKTARFATLSDCQNKGLQAPNEPKQGG